MKIDKHFTKFPNAKR